jgi:glycosyltransferase involved in cell wall biosynthesis
VSRELVAQSPDLVASHFALYTRPALRAIRQLPFVVHFHGPWAAEAEAEGAGRTGQWVKRSIERPVYRAADRLVVLSRAFGQILCRDYGVDEARIRVIPGGVDAARFHIPESRSDARRRLGWPIDRPIVLTVRRLARRMGLEDLIDAVREIRDRIPDVLVLIAGSGKLAKQLRQRIEWWGLEHNVRLLGFVPDEDLPLAYRAADLTVVPSVALEGFGLVAAESLSAGTPVVVTPVGGLPEVVEGLCRDLILSEPTAGAIAETLIAFLFQQIKAPEKCACQQYASRHFHWPVVASRVRAVYQEALVA